MGPGGFFPTNPDLPDIFGRTDFDFDNFHCLDFLDLKFPNVQVPDFQISRNLAWAQLGPTFGPGLGLAQAWAKAWAPRADVFTHLCCSHAWGKTELELF